MQKQGEDFLAQRLLARTCVFQKGVAFGLGMFERRVLQLFNFPAAVRWHRPFLR
jgi:hypothetical protein